MQLSVAYLGTSDVQLALSTSLVELDLYDRMVDLFTKICIIIIINK